VQTAALTPHISDVLPGPGRDDPALSGAEPGGSECEPGCWPAAAAAAAAVVPAARRGDSPGAEAGRARALSGAARRPRACLLCVCVREKLINRERERERGGAGG
jgi:hypothetical protein